MSNAQKWVAVVLVSFLVLLFVGFLTNPEEENYLNNFSENQSQQIEEKSTQQIYLDADCVTCHGANQEGTENGPSLKNLSTKWTKQEIISYLRNPDDFKNDDRILALNSKYPDSFMPNYNNMDIKDLGKLADLLLQK
jgi:mono/diheme cytochrome c family protein